MSSKLKHWQTHTGNDEYEPPAVSDSPLLRLPPELRNRIYALVLGVGHIHVRYRPWRRDAAKGGKGSGKGGSVSSGSNEAGFYALALPADADPWGKKARVSAASLSASSPTSPSPTASFSSLLLVCRQIHAEAALLPFSLNAWSFEDARVMERYLVRDRRLALAQRRAIRVLVVADDLPSRSMERYLRGLRVVVWRDASTKTFERWELPRPVVPRRTLGEELLLYD